MDSIKRIIKKYNINVIDVLITLTFIIINIVCFREYSHRYVPKVDFSGNWTLCGYVLHGVNPLKIIPSEMLIPELGSTPRGYGNTPFGLLLGNLFYFGFLPKDNAYFAMGIVTIFLIVLTICFAIDFFKANFPKYYHKLSFYFSLLTILSIHIFASYRAGNIGHIICLLILLSIFTIDKYTCFSSVCLALSMIKPQISFPFILLFLMYKKVKIVSIAAFIDIIASIVCAILVKENVIQLFIDFLHSNVGGGANPCGMLTFLSIENSYKMLFPSMAAGIFLLILSRYLIHNNKNYLMNFSYTAMISSIWSYCWSSDNYILIIPSIMSIYMMMELYNNKIKNKVLYMYYFIEYFFFIFMLAIRSFLRMLQGRYGFFTSKWSGDWFILGKISYTYTVIITIFFIFSSIILYNYLEKKYKIK